MIDTLAKELVMEFPTLSMDEAKVVALAYRMKDMKSMPLFVNQKPPPDGYFDSTMKVLHPELPQHISVYCRELVSKKFLCKHSSMPEMVRIADELIPLCERILNRSPYLGENNI